MSFLRIVLVAAAILAAGCATTSSDNQVSSRDAARYNVQLGMSYLQREIGRAHV